MYGARTSSAACITSSKPDLGSLVRAARLSIFLAAATLLIAPQRAAAAPAFGDLFDLRQPDGTTCKVAIWGDEYYQVVESLDGYTLVLDPDTGIICYADLSFDGNDLVSTGVEVQEIYPGGLGVVPHLRINPEAARAQRIDGMARFEEGVVQTKIGMGMAAAAPAPAPPTTGSVFGITLIVDFSDSVGTILQ